MGGSAGETQASSSVDRSLWFRRLVTTIELRRARPEDAAAVAAIFLESFHATYEFPLAHSDDDVRGWIRDHVVAALETWVAVAGDEIVGMMALAPGWLEQLYVRPDRLGQGIGSELVALAKERQPNALELWTFQVNERARRFYERHGFVVVEETDGSGNEEHQPDVRYRWSPKMPSGPR